MGEISIYLYAIKVLMAHALTYFTCTRTLESGSFSSLVGESLREGRLLKHSATYREIQWTVRADLQAIEFIEYALF